jgi:hypothetical protein
MPNNSPIDERLASARAIVEAMVGMPIVIAQQTIQNIGDATFGSDVTVAQRVVQLRSLGEMVVRMGGREISRRLGKRPQ